MRDLNNYKIHSLDEILAIGKKVIPDKFINRFEEISDYNILYENDRDKIYEYYTNELQKYDVFKERNFNKMMLTPNYCSKSTNALLKFAMSEPPIYSLSKSNDALSKFINDYVNNFEFNEKIKQIITRVDVTGNCFVRIIPSLKYKELYDLQILDSCQVFVVTDIMTDEVIAYVVTTLYEMDGKTYGKYLVSEIGKNSYYDVKIDNGTITDFSFDREEKLPFNDFSVFNFVVSPDYNNQNYGISSYRDLVPLQSNYIYGINMIMATISNYTSPTMYGPPINANAGSEKPASSSKIPNVPVPVPNFNTGKAVMPEAANVGSKSVSLAGKYINIPDSDAVKPAYVSWDAQINQQMDFYMKFIRNDIGNFSQFPEIVKDEESWGANITSGKALKLKQMSAIDKSQNFCNTIKPKLERLLAILTKTNNSDNKIIIDFQDGIVDFPDEVLEYASKRIADGTFSKADAISYMDGLTHDEAIKKVEEIEKENAEQNNYENNNLNKGGDNNE